MILGYLPWRADAFKKSRQFTKSVEQVIEIPNTENPPPPKEEPKSVEERLNRYYSSWDDWAVDY
jgi:hypothetical protein